MSSIKGTPKQPLANAPTTSNTPSSGDAQGSSSLARTAGLDARSSLAPTAGRSKPPTKSEKASGPAASQAVLGGAKAHGLAAAAASQEPAEPPLLTKQQKAFIDLAKTHERTRADQLDSLAQQCCELAMKMQPHELEQMEASAAMLLARLADPKTPVSEDLLTKLSDVGERLNSPRMLAELAGQTAMLFRNPNVENPPWNSLFKMSARLVPQHA